MSDNASLSDITTLTTSGADSAPQKVTKRRQGLIIAEVIRPISPSFPTPSPTRRGRCRAGRRSGHEPRPARRKPRKRQPFPPPAAVPAWARASGRAGRAIPSSPPAPSLALLDAALRRDPPAAGALRSRLALQSAAASAKILRLNADAAALRDLRFAATAEPLPAAKLLQLWRDCRPAAQSRRSPACRRRGPPRPSRRGPRRPGGKPVGDAPGRGSGLRRRKGGRRVVRRLPGRPGRRSRNSGPLGVRHASSRSGCAGRGPCR